MDVEKLIERLKKASADGSWNTLADYAHKAATALSTLQAENEKLRYELQQIKRDKNALLESYLKNGEEMQSLAIELERVKRERYAAISLLHNWEQYGHYLSSMGFTVPPNWKEDEHEQ